MITRDNLLDHHELGMYRTVVVNPCSVSHCFGEQRSGPGISS